MARLTKKSSVIELEDELMEMEEETDELSFDDEEEIDFDFDEEDDEEFEDEEEEVEEEIEEDEEEEEPEPVKKSKPVKKEVVKPSKKVKEKPALEESKPKAKKEKVTSKSSGKTRNPAKVKEHQTYEALMEQVNQKVDNYDRIMTERAYGKSKALPQSTAISKDLFIKLLVAKASETNDRGMKLAMKKAMVSMGFDGEDVKDALEGYHFKETEMLEVYTQMFDLMYDILSAGSGFPLFKTEDCNATLEGRWTEESLRTNEHLNTEYATRIESFLKVSAKSVAPTAKKQQGHIKGNKFVPVKK